MRQYEVTFIVDPVLSGDEIKEAAQTYVDLIGNENNKIVHVDEMGLRQLAYPINKRTSGVYYCVEFQNDEGNFIPKMELALRRDERIMRFLTVKLDKYGVKYNDDKRNGLIGKKRLRMKEKQQK
jgi:small subunit ribosomal protein S6